MGSCVAEEDSDSLPSDAHRVTDLGGAKDVPGSPREVGTDLGCAKDVSGSPREVGTGVMWSRWGRFGLPLGLPFGCSRV